VEIRGRVRSAEFHTVSGDLSIDLDPDPAGRESRMKTISGDVEIGLIGSSCLCDFHTASGDLECEPPANIIREGRKDRKVIIGDGRGRVLVKTVSGDLTIKRTSSDVTEEPLATPSAEREPEPEAEEVERTAPMAPPVTVMVRDLLERVARGEVSVDEAAARLDETRRGR
jgi:hypothetical protein